MKATHWNFNVLIPARNEEELLPGCLNSVLEAGARLPAAAKFHVVVAVDSSTDGTGEIAAEMLKGSGSVIHSDAGVVGRARALAARTALERHRGALDRCWLANTDADCLVPQDWLLDQLALANSGIEAYAGMIDVDNFENHASPVRERFYSTYRANPDGSHFHVHGANLGVRADAYRRAGGWGPIPTAEDHDLWNRLAEIGARRLSLSRIRVVTSGRIVGRAPHGFAAALAAHGNSAV